MDPDWLRWAKRIRAIAQNGLTYTTNQYDRERYEELRDIAAELLAESMDAPIGEIRGVLAREMGYATPKADVRGVIIRDNEILLVREIEDGGWTLPGGWADEGASLKENVEREVREEAGLTVNAVRLMAVFDRSLHPHTPPFPFHIYKHFILCEPTGGELSVSMETSAVGYFSEDKLPPLSISRVTPWQIAEMFRLFRDPSAPTLFD